MAGLNCILFGEHFVLHENKAPSPPLTHPWQQESDETFQVHNFMFVVFHEEIKATERQS